MKSPNRLDYRGIGNVCVFRDQRQSVDFRRSRNNPVELIAVGQSQFRRGKGQSQV
jgi:hypothetical protein